MIHDNPYDQAAADNAAEDRRQALAEGAEEAMNERRQMGPLYWASLDDWPRSPPDDLTHDASDGE